MKRSACTAFAVVLALLPATSACGSGESLKPITTSTASESSPSDTFFPTEPPKSLHEAPELAAAEAFTTYAQGGRAGVPWADTVAYRIRGALVARFDPAFADRRETWDGCPPEETTYEGRDCPVSPLRTIAFLDRDGAEVVYETEAPPTVGCNRYQSAGAAKATVWIRPPEDRRDCFSDFAVAVSLDRWGRVASVDLALSGP